MTLARQKVSGLLLGLIAATAGFAADVTVNDLFRAGNITDAELSPDGRYVAWRQVRDIYVGNDEVDYNVIHSFSDNAIVTNVEWTGLDTLVVQTRGKVSGDSQLWVTRLGNRSDGSFGVVEENRYNVPGHIVDPLIESPEEVVFARWNLDADFVHAELFRIDLFETRTKRAFNRNARIDIGKAELDYLLADAAGNYVVGTREFEGVPELWQRVAGTGQWTKIWEGNENVSFELASLSEDGKSVWALTDAFTDTVAAVEFNLQSRALQKVLYQHDRFDVARILNADRRGAPEGVAFADQGLLRFEFFDEERKAEYRAIESRFPDAGIAIVGRSSDLAVLLVHTFTSNSRGHIYRCYADGSDCTVVGAVAPWLDGKPLGETVALQVQSTDAIVVDAYLTLPVSPAESVPLIAMPHGGPIGVSDDRHFSGDVQWLAANGYAVLQVNYRGSEGYGRAFEASGLRQWGRGIEDDIEASVLQVIERYPQIDADRVGIFGASYGGYSALMSVIRNPDLFRCAASFAGVTDLTLLFLQSRMRDNDALRDDLVRKIGNPVRDLDEQRSNSPVYRYKEISRPVFLAHGTADNIVDVEHSWRLRKLLELRGNPPTMVILDDVGHGFEYTNEAEDLYEPLVRFLDKHLKR